jgi:hypothetical protein
MLQELGYDQLRQSLAFEHWLWRKKTECQLEK